jgi:NADH:ubiquinone oxidoreductase subunit E
MIQHKRIIKKYSSSIENVLLILHELQRNNPQNYLKEKDLAWVADYLNVTYGQVYGIASYYTLFSLKPRGRHIFRVCRSPVCQMLGANNIIMKINQALNINLGETTNDGLFTLESTECIGHCEIAPCLSVDDSVYGIVKPYDIDGILKNYTILK